MKKESIADLLADYRRAKSAVKALRTGMIEMAITDFGMTETAAREIGIEAFFDGYLAGAGHSPAHRKQNLLVVQPFEEMQK